MNVLLTATASCAVLANALPGPASASAYFNEWTKRLDMALSRDAVSAANAAFVIVDMQNDFVGEFAYTQQNIDDGLSPCSTLLNSTAACFGVKEGHVAASVIADVLASHKFATVIASMDDHKSDHCSFLASSGTTSPPAACADNFEVSECDANAFHKCRGTIYENHVNKGTVYGPFPPHCVRGLVGTEFYAPIFKALASYTHEKYVAIKGLDTTTDSFGVFRYSEESFNFYDKAGLFGPNPSPAALIRSMLTWEQHMNTSTGAASYSVPFDNQYIQPPRFSRDGSSGISLTKTSTEDIVANNLDVNHIIVSGLAGDWCVLDTALNAKAQWPGKDVYIMLDAARPSYLPLAVAKQYLKANPASQLYDGGAWLHAPSDVKAVLQAAGVKLIYSSQLA